ncbi:hypothetical protein IJ596_06320 [bacterium]|nr:hypothetical protein [bacterium]
MGLTDRFKEFKEKSENKVVVLSPQKEQIEVKKKESNSYVQEITNSIVDKIKNTPYWDDYTVMAQRKMIMKYFEAKMDGNCDDISVVSGDDKLDFIDSVMKLVK